MAKKLRLKVIAEGVESWGQLDFLDKNGCDMVQGYLLGRPEPADTLVYRLSQPPEAVLNR